MAFSKKANKKSTKGTNKSWKKGQSCSFNPKFNKFRLEAKKKQIFGNRGTGDLTAEKLASHDRITSEQQYDKDVDLTSIGGDTAISAFTNCSLPTFSRLIKNWNAGSLLHKEMIAVLAAVTDVLKTYGGKETETEYFAALMTTLDVVDTEEGVTAVICLMSMVVKRLDENILKLQYDTACDKFSKLLIKYMNSEHGALLRNLLKIMYCFLKVNKKWGSSSSEKISILLEFAVHHKPKVRKTAHQIIRALITENKEPSLIQPALSVVAKFCISKLENYGGPSGSKEIFYVLSLLQEIIGVFPSSNIKKMCETVLRVMTLSNSIVTSGCLKTLKGLFEMKPKSENLPSDLNARIIMALYDYQPNLNESQALINWLQVMDVAFVNLKELDGKLCIGHLPKFYFTAVKCWQSDREEVLEAVGFTLMNLIHVCINPSQEAVQQCLLSEPINNPIHKMFHYVEEALGYQYHKAWKYVMAVLAAFFEVIGKHSYTVMLKCLQSLADLHDSYKFPHISELERAIGIAIQSIGPKIVLQAIPLEISGESDKPHFPRSWLLPLLRNYIKRTELKFFIQYFMPLAAKLRQKVFSLQQEERIVESKLYDVICSQIWDLLPGFCNEPTDLKQCFKDVARVLGAILNEEPSLRMTVMNSLRTLINKNLNNEENRNELSRFCKNYLPILFNLYSTEPKDKAEEKVRLAVYETAKAFLRISDMKLCDTFFEKAFEKLNSPDLSPFMQQSMIDIIRAILPYVDSSQISKIYEYCKPLLKDSNHTTQKKSYSVLNEICSSDSESCKLFVKEHLDDIRPLLCGAASGLTPATRALRLNILGHIIKQLSSDEKDFIASIVPEAVLCTKENSVKARAVAYNLLITIGNVYLDWQPTNSKEAMCEYLKVLLAGLAGSPHLMSATILAIGRVLYEFKDKFDSKLINLLIENVCLLLTSKSREVVMSALSFIKILFTTIPTEDLIQHVEFMVKSITSISEDNQRHFRFKAKELFTRLVRKFGYEMISKLVPDNYQKQLNNIRKTEARKARKKNTIDDEDESPLPSKDKTAKEFDAILADSDEEMATEFDFEKSTKISQRKKTNFGPMIEEHGEDDIVDLMDPAVNKRLLTSKPEKTSMKIKKDFPVSEDGRLIITENDVEITPETKGEKKDERKKLLSDLGEMFKKGNKKRKYEESDDDDDNIQNAVTKGIHRTLDPKAKKKAPGSEFKAKKAGGDMKKGNVNPYAYLPLNREFLNKRKQAKIKGQFKNIVKGARKGAKVGIKKKIRNDTRKKRKHS